MKLGSDLITWRSGRGKQSHPCLEKNIIVEVDYKNQVRVGEYVGVEIIREARLTAEQLLEGRSLRSCVSGYRLATKRSGDSERREATVELDDASRFLCTVFYDVNTNTPCLDVRETGTHIITAESVHAIALTRLYKIESSTISDRKGSVGR